jgi:hypothetical protein
MVLMNLANFSQYERELTSERTRAVFQYMKAQGVRLGPAPYGYELSHEVDEKGRRRLVPLDQEQAVLRKIESLRKGGLSLREIAKNLNEARIPARRDGIWRPQRISIVLQRAGKHTVRAYKSPGPRVPLHHDPEAATVRARELRAQGLSLREVGLRLRKERLTPLRGGVWHPAQVAGLLRGARHGDREAAARRAAELRAQGMQLREIGVRLVTDGFLPKEGGIWHPAQVHALLASMDSGLSAK